MSLGPIFQTNSEWKKRVMVQKKEEKGKERCNLRVKPIIVDPFGVPSFFLRLSSEWSLPSSVSTVQHPFTHTLKCTQYRILAFAVASVD